ncbi:gliding motility-associated protein GldE [Paramuribaculum intestinale]|jgi:gliding motility-associated protein GldE|uniref:Gliding motility-associated protein GldE n=1 Tax=Paramuribaculum intestinale TaxID=2094151 RepID=A0A2V1IQK5_9BACT|nr:gliding motility-associated protein GldE [Paramuribaculum intestinale]ROS94431.1 gliding motility-associated protein GldE [Muribaculaceae bacterium Isolate-043 (Harlan)]ROT16839.1 gliding motility-associated protein GldE [Muribaculaceae bacterium Isolate-105 (HZI)]RXE61631.1 gliding motility-associated protein GldE [Muribaculaceae bacterium Isolate-004 (NCI)]MCX4330084.1 gliding motility-associated protein GldE [Paramuribaculum intestinale]PWB06803.1 gliding motility-associated protein GldE
MADTLGAVLSALQLNFPANFGLDQMAALVVALCALMISGFVSGSEIAFFSLTPQQCDELDETPRGQNVLAMIGKPERLLATILIANNLVNVTIVILCNYALGPVFQGMAAWMSFLLQTVILTFLILLFGEILPKLIANSDNMRWIRFALGGVKLMMAVFSPISSLLVRGSTIVNRVVVKKESDVTAEELSQALEITDVSAGDEKEMLEGILRFGDKTANEVMTPRVDMTCVDLSSDFDEVMSTVVESGYSRLPACDGSQDDIKGVLYSRDLLPYIGKDAADFDWRTLLREPYFVPEARSIDDLLEDFRRRHIHMAIVIDEFGGTQGLVTLEDVLEEIVGDINDEYDEDEKTYRRLPDDTFIFEGKTLLDDFFRVTDLNEADYSDVTADCETLAGMLLAIKGDFPKEKEPMVYGRCRFLVLEINGHRIVNVRVKVMPEDVEPKGEA